MRIAGITIPENKRLEIGLTAVYGVGRSRARKILLATKIDLAKKPKDLTPEEENEIRKTVESNRIEGDLKREVSANIKRLKDIKTYLEQLSKIKPKNLNEYEKDFKTKAACERYFEKIAEATLDLAVLVIKERGLPIPEQDYEAFDTLEKEKLIDNVLAKKLRDIKGMRNIIAHQYGDVDDKIMYNSISKELDKDVNMFLRMINKLKL